MGKKKPHFLKEKYLDFCNKKFPKDKINDQIIAGECDATERTVLNWASPIVGSMPKASQIKDLSRLAAISIDELFNDFLYIPEK